MVPHILAWRDYFSSFDPKRVTTVGAHRFARYEKKLSMPPKKRPPQENDLQIVTHNETETQEYTEKLRRVEYNLLESARQKEAAMQKEAAAQEASPITDDTQQGNTEPQSNLSQEEEYNSLIKELDRFHALKQKLTTKAEAQQRQIKNNEMMCKAELRGLQKETTELDGNRLNPPNINVPPQPSANSNDIRSFDASSTLSQTM